MARKRAQSPPKSPAPRERARAKKRGSDDDNVKSSQHILALHPILKKTGDDDKETQQLRTKVAGDQRALRTLLQQRQREADRVQCRENERERRREDISDIITSAFTPTASSNDPINQAYAAYPGTTIALNPLFASVADMINTSHGLVAEYDRLETMVTETAQDNESRQPITDKYQEEVKEMEKLLKVGHRNALRNVKKVMRANHEDVEVNGTKEVEGEVDEYGETMEMQLNYELETALRYVERGIRRMTKGLPRNNEAE
ncbi:hypothetical protein K505DRAFT_413173 [Melanomma pulvis-pyrius CBS 109.77]|uniref:Uncharacterized protein n=1 Tax=Melanomma pulvis-pyrius CBS 109.77 TaxID=1314802 RepID=A0A6A6XUB4_9PLEO|nr:hypothetical protein K505DRAFT_413173 [Melanomma pulvis-pyrius CBS 109.77]